VIYEYRAYYVMPGRMPDLQRRFADVTMKLFKKHGINVVGFWETIVGESNEMVYICSYDDLAHRERVGGPDHQLLRVVGAVEPAAVAVGIGEVVERDVDQAGGRVQEGPVATQLIQRH